MAYKELKRKSRKKTPSLQDAATRRLGKRTGQIANPIDQQWGGGVQYSPEELSQAMSYMEERQALAGLDEGSRFGGKSPTAGLPAPGGGVRGGDTATELTLQEFPTADDNLPVAFRDTPLGRKVIRDGWSLSPEDKRALEILIANQLKTGGQF